MTGIPARPADNLRKAYQMDGMVGACGLLTPHKQAGKQIHFLAV
ncbi:hypothetical protein [Nitrosomonas communis]|nr:hypothetical protein [Nitrosomonas communis]